MHTCIHSYIYTSNQRLKILVALLVEYSQELQNKLTIEFRCRVATLSLFCGDLCCGLLKGCELHVSSRLLSTLVVTSSTGFAIFLSIAQLILVPI
jgi:hypothetical protein